MLLEARALAKLQVDEKLGHSEVGLTLGVDGTSKHQKHFGAASVHYPDSQTTVLGVTNMGAGTAQSYLRTVKDLLEDVAGFSNMVAGEVQSGQPRVGDPDDDNIEKKTAEYGRLLYNDICNACHCFRVVPLKMSRR